MSSRLTEVRNILVSSGILTSFSGLFSQVLIEEIGNAVKTHMKNQDRPQNDIFNVFSIFIEQSQNMKNYVMSKMNLPVYNRIANSTIISIGQNEDNYFIWSSNAVENADVGPLCAVLDKVRNASKEELKKLYKEQILKSVEPEQIGAGIGFIDIAKKASQPFEYTIDQINETYSIFELKVII